MIYLQNNTLKVSILHPQEDIPFFGSRYSHGCHIWQIEDLHKGNLFSGPAYPSPNPPVFDSQGIPDVFETALGTYPSNIGDSVLVIGVGEVTKSSSNEPFHTRWNPQIKQRCLWDIVQDNHSIQMSTEQLYKGYHFKLSKTVVLDNRTIRCINTCHNYGLNPLPIRWFTHPFFPLNKDFSCCKVTPPIGVPSNSGFILTNELLSMNNSYDWGAGCYRTLEITHDIPHSITVNHPLVDTITIKTGYAPSWLPIWANKSTFSIEPFFTRVVIPGEECAWDITFEV